MIITTAIIIIVMIIIIIANETAEPSGKAVETADYRTACIKREHRRKISA